MHKKQARNENIIQAIIENRNKNEIQKNENKIQASK